MSAVATETADRILDAACEIIAEEGIDEVRIARVATAGPGFERPRPPLLLDPRGAPRAGARPLLRARGRRPLRRRARIRRPGSAAETFGLAIRECLPFPGESEREWVLWVELWLRAVREPGLREVAAEAL